MRIFSFIFVSWVLSAAAAFGAEAPPALQTLRADFAKAILARNASDAAKFAFFPLDNRVYRESDKISRGEFLHNFSTMYIPQGKCIKNSKLDKVPTNGGLGHSLWEIDCDGNIFHFGTRGSRWFYTGYENVNE